MSNTIYLGIDPGKSGALAVMADDVVVFPFDEHVYRNVLSSLSGKETICCLEHVNAMPGQGVVSMFNFGMNFGFIQGLLTAFNIPFELVRPQKWKKEFGITADKNSSIAVCKRLFPSVSLLPTERSRKENDGMAEAALMALYAKRKLTPMGGYSETDTLGNKIPF